MASRNDIQALYLAYFGRPADPAALPGWEGTGLTASEIVLIFVDTDEYKYNTLRPNTQGETTNLSGLINTYYNRLFARDASQQDINGWVEQLNTGGVNVDYLGISIANAGLNYGQDLGATLSNKIVQANRFDVELAKSNSLTQKYSGWLADDIGIEFNSKISENTTDSEANNYQLEAFERLPEPGVLIEVSENSTTVAEGNSVGVVVEGFGPDLAGETLEYAIVGSNGFGAGDLVDGSLVGSVTLDANGNGLIQVSIKADGVDLGESFTVRVSSTLGGSVSTGVITVEDAPAPVPILSVSPSSQSVDEGEDITFAITSSDLAPGTSLSWIISGVNSADLSGADTTGTVALDSNGLAFVTFAVAEDLTFEGSETADFLVVASPTVNASTSVVINDTSIPPTASLQVQVQPAAVNEGQFLTFSITSENLAAGRLVAWNAGDLSPQDVVGGIVDGTVALNADGEATVVLVTSEDASVNEGDETFAFTATSSGLTASVEATIYDSSVAPVQAVLTENTDIVENALVTGFTIIGNEETLGQNDQISSAPSGATLNIGTEFDFQIGNFTTDNIETFLFSPSEALGERGEIDMRNAVGVENLNVNRSNLDAFQFDDLQSAVNLTANLDDSFTDFEFNFDSTALTGGDDSLNVVFSEAPVDAASGESLGIVATQGPTHAAASIETLNLTSTGVSDTNILGALSVGPDLEELNIDGTVDLNVLQDIGLPQDTDLRVVDEAGNSDVSLIDARGLAADLFGGVSAYTTAPTGNSYFTYTSEVVGDVEVFGATGDNYLQLVSGLTKGGTTSFIVETQDGDDDVLTDIGNDDVDAGEGNNTVYTFDGNDDVVTLEGDDVIDTGDGFDFVSSGGGDDNIDAGDGNDIVQAGNGDNTVFSFGGDNEIFSLEGNDLIVTTDGNDFINSGFGNDTVIAGTGGDTVVSLGGDNVINTTAFNAGDITDDSSDSVVTGAGNDTINTGGGNDVVDSGAGDDYVVDGNVTSPTIGLDDDGNTFNLGLDNDELSMNLENLQLNDVIDGGLGIDTVTFSEGGVLRQTETLQTSNVEAFNLIEGGNFEVTLSEDLIETSDDIVGNQRIFSVYTGSTPTISSLDDSAGNVTLDLTNLAPISEGLANVPLINSVRYFGQNDDSTERVIVTDRMMSSFTHLSFGELTFVQPGIDTDAVDQLDILVVQDEIELSTSDLSNVDGLEVIDLTATTNGDINFVLDFTSMTIGDFQRLVGDFPLTYTEDTRSDDGLLIRATESLNVASASTLNLILPIEVAAAAYIGERISIEESAELNVEVFNEVVGFEVDISTALFFTPNPDDLSPTDEQTVIAYELSDVQTADKVQGTDLGDEKIEFKFGLANDIRTMQEQLDNVFTSSVDVFDFNPGAVNQAVRFEGLFGDNLGSGEVQTIFGLDSIFTSGGDDRMIEIEGVQRETSLLSPFIATQLFVDSAEGNDTVTTANFDQNALYENAQITVTAGAGDDSVHGFNGFNSDDSLFGQQGNDTIRGFRGDDVIFGDLVGFLGNLDGDDFLSGGDGEDAIFGGDGNNTVAGGSGNDLIVTGLGADSIIGGLDEDSIISGAGNDIVFGNDGFDTIFGNDGDDLIEGNLGGDLIFGGADNDSIYGDFRSPSSGGDDTMSGGTGNDFIFTGLGEDIASGDGDNDIIVFGNGFIFEEFTNDAIETPTQTEQHVFAVSDGFTDKGTADGFFTVADSVDGGLGDDVLSFTMGTLEGDLTLKDREFLIQGAEVSGIETINVKVDNKRGDGTPAAILTIDNSILKEVEADSQGVKTLRVNVAGEDQAPNDPTFDPAGSLNFDATSFVQDQRVVLYDSDLFSAPENNDFIGDPAAINRRQFGSGDDLYANNTVYDLSENETPSVHVVIEGNGGADTMYLSGSGSNFFREYVKYNTGNDGGVGGASTGGDTIYNFNSDEGGQTLSGRDLVLIGEDGGLPGTIDNSSATGLLFDLTQRQASFEYYAQLYGSVNEQLTLGGQTAYDDTPASAAPLLAAGGDNFLFLTGPARSLQDDELTSAAAIAQAINNVGVVSNGLSFGAKFGADTVDASGNVIESPYTIEQQSNQALIVQQGQFDSAVWLYIEDDLEFTVGEAHTAEASELRQLGIFKDALLTFEDFRSDALTPVEIL